MCVCISPAVLVALLGTRNRFGVGSTGAVFYAGMLSSYSSLGAMSWPWSHPIPIPPGSMGKSLGWIFHLLIFSAMPISFRIFCTRVVQVSTMGAVQYSFTGFNQLSGMESNWKIPEEERLTTSVSASECILKLHYTITVASSGLTGGRQVKETSVSTLTGS